MFEVCLRDSQLHHHFVEMLWELPNRCHEVQSSRFFVENCCRVWVVCESTTGSGHKKAGIYMKLHFLSKSDAKNT